MNPVNYVSAALSRSTVVALRVMACLWLVVFFTQAMMGWNTSFLPYKALARTETEQVLSSNETTPPDPVQDSLLHASTVEKISNASLPDPALAELPPAHHTSPRLGQIRDKVAFIVETQYTQHLLPLILHFHGVLGPDWPIVFYTSEEMIAQHLSTAAGSAASSVWAGAVAAGAVDVRAIPADRGFDLSTRVGVNRFLADRWLWAALAPARHVLLFQSDSIICANSPHRAEDFAQWDFIGAPPLEDRQWYHGGLTLRNRTMIMDILEAEGGADWLAETKAGTEGGGEDIWFANKMLERGGNLPWVDYAVEFAVEFDWNWERSKTPFGFHKVHADAAASMGEIAEYCPEIALAVPGILPNAP